MEILSVALQSLVRCSCVFRNSFWLGLKLCVFIRLLGISTKPSIQVQPSEVQKTSFKPNYTLRIF